MLRHLVNLLFESVAAVPKSMGSTWLGLLFPVFVFLVALAISIAIKGWRDAVRDWRRYLTIGTAAAVIAWFALYLYCLAEMTYKDHAYLVTAASRFKVQAQSQKQADEEAFDPIRSGLQTKLTALQRTCDKQAGVAETLEKQNRDQQGSINNCQSQALKLLAPTPLHLVFLTMSQTSPSDGRWITQILGLTNRTITPIHLNAFCDRPLNGVQAGIVGENFSMGGASLIAPKYAQINIGSPAWTEVAPMLITFNYQSATADIHCQFINH